MLSLPELLPECHGTTHEHERMLDRLRVMPIPWLP
jgi:hypothetical protein